MAELYLFPPFLSVQSQGRLQTCFAASTRGELGSQFPFLHRHGWLSAGPILCELCMLRGADKGSVNCSSSAASAVFVTFAYMYFHCCKDVVGERSLQAVHSVMLFHGRWKEEKAGMLWPAGRSVGPGLGWAGLEEEEDWAVTAFAILLFL